MRLLLVLVLFAHPLRRSDRRVSLAVTVDDLTLDLPWVCEPRSPNRALLRQHEAKSARVEPSRYRDG
jgi:hypothetical protein